METTRQSIFNFTPPTSNIDILEGAVMHAMTLCGGCTSDAAIQRFAVKYSAVRGKKLRTNYAATKLIPRLMAERKIFRISNQSHMYTLNPVFAPDNQFCYDAFWVYLEFVTSLDVVASTMAGYPPAQISFIRNNAIYHVVRVEGNGYNELLKLMRHEMDMKARMKNEKYAPKEKAILVFDSIESARACQYKLINIDTMYCIISYAPGELTPCLQFCRPDEINSNQKPGQKTGA